MLCSVIPERTRFLILLAEPSISGIIERMRNLFDLAFCLGDEELKRSVAHAFVEALDDEEKNGILFESVLFRPKYLHYLEKPTCKRMLRHLLARLQNEMSVPALQLVDGLEEFLFDSDDLLAWLRTLVVTSLAAPCDSGTEIRDYARRAYGSLSANQKRIVVEKQTAVFLDCERDGNAELGGMLRRLQDDWSVASVNSAQPLNLHVAKATSGR
jgi:hypothetical protein